MTVCPLYFLILNGLALKFHREREREICALERGVPRIFRACFYNYPQARPLPYVPGPAWQPQLCASWTGGAQSIYPLRARPTIRWQSETKLRCRAKSNCHTCHSPSCRHAWWPRVSFAKFMQSATSLYIPNPTA